MLYPSVGPRAPLVPPLSAEGRSALAVRAAGEADMELPGRIGSLPPRPRGVLQVVFKAHGRRTRSRPGDQPGILREQHPAVGALSHD